MSRRSRKHRKQFVCGHRGFGKYCHRCADAHTKKQKRLQQRQRKRQTWQELFEADPIELKHLPKAVISKARKVISALEQGQKYWHLSGKRLNMARDIVKIPVTHRYRLLCRDDGKTITPVEVVSHEDYNPLVTRPKRLLQRLFNSRVGARR